MATVVPPEWPRDVLTLSEWIDLEPDEDRHIECVEGVLFVAPTPHPMHQAATAELVHILKEQLRPYGLSAVPDTDVLLTSAPLTIRAPDVVVARRERIRADPARFERQDVVLAVEIVSESSRRTDRVMKANEYAEAGIGEYWIVEGNPFVLSAFILESGVYRLTGEFVGTADLTVAGVPVHVDLDALLDV